MQVEVLLKAVADKQRLKILASLIDEPKFVEQLALELNISVSTTSFHLGKLQSAGLVSSKKEQYYQTYFVNERALECSLRELVSFGVGEDSSNAFEKNVIKDFVKKGKPISKLPVQIRKREIIFREILKEFSKNKKYSLKETNLIIADFCDDFATCRNEMLRLKLLEEKDGVFKKLE